ncbi:MAG: MazG family protein [Gemmiger sp.]
MTVEEKKLYTLEDLRAVIARLRDPVHGCPWDSVQTHQSIRMNFLEEAYEAVDAIDLDDPALLCEELGDVLMQVVFHTCIEEEKGRFHWEQVCDGVCRKLIERHPFLFAENPEQQGINDWDALKNKEKGRLTLAQDLTSVPKAMPALMRTAKLQKRAARYGCTEQSDPAALEAAARQVCAAAGSGEAESAVGELLFQAVALARAAGVDPEQALQRRSELFIDQAKAPGE